MGRKVLFLSVIRSSLTVTILVGFGLNAGSIMGFGLGFRAGGVELLGLGVINGEGKNY